MTITLGYWLIPLGLTIALLAGCWLARGTWRGGDPALNLLALSVALFVWVVYLALRLYPWMPI